MDFLLTAFIVFYCDVVTAIIHKRPSLFEEFSAFKEIKVSVFDGSNRVTSTFNSKTGLPLPTIRVEFDCFGTPLVLDLKLNKALLPARYTERVSNSTRKSSDASSFCYYVGHVIDRTNRSSWSDTVVAATTCSGFRAYIVTPSDVLHVEPMSPRLEGPHVLFRDSDSSINNKYVSVSSSAFSPSRTYHRNQKDLLRRRRRKRRRVQWPYDVNNETLVVELYMVNDHSQFKSQGSNVDEVIQRTISIANIVNSLYRSLNIYIALVGVEVWSDVDRIVTAETSEGTMNNFLEYRKRYINFATPNDNAQMISSRSFGEGVVGKAPIMTLCSWQYSGGINLDHSHLVGKIATTVAHELGHNFGMTHDTEESRCPDDKCIMSPSSGGPFNPAKWSDTSKEQLSDALAQGMHHCLHNVPLKLFGDDPVCGDGFVDRGEECDCGLPQDCTSTCCNAATCTFLPRAQCSSGSCCDLKTCQLKPAMHECRPAKDDCDLGEYCDGMAEFCPFDVYKHDGYRCSVDKVEAYCFSGQCRTHDTQCKKLWGHSGRSSHNICYNVLNVLGNQTGNCGLNWTVSKTYDKCLAGNELCGMLHCEHTSEKLMFWKESLTFDLPDSFVLLNGTRFDCKAAILDIGLDSNNPGLAPDGSKCGPDMMCVSQKCISVEEVKRPDCPNCNGHGICNSIGQCHCNPGWAPPHCDLSGGGGSLHSGQTEQSGNSIGLTVGMCFFFLFLLPAFIFCVIFLYRRRTHFLKKIGYNKASPVQVPARPPRPPGFPSSELSAGKTSNAPRRPLPPPYKPPSPPHRAVSFSSHDTNKYQLPPPRLPPKSKIVSSSSFNRHLPHKVDSVGLRDALSELQQIDFLKGDEESDANLDRVPLVADDGKEAADDGPARLVPFRKAPPPPPPPSADKRDGGIQRSVSLKPPVRPPPPPKLHRV